jgi:hypothetical protein
MDSNGAGPSRSDFGAKRKRVSVSATREDRSSAKPMDGVADLRCHERELVIGVTSSAIK